MRNAFFASTRVFILIFLELLAGMAQPASAAQPSLILTPIGGVLRNGEAWRSYKQRFVSASGRVVDTGNGSFSHSEGQGYGLLLSVAAADRPAFDQILKWTRQNLFVRRDNLAAWRWMGTTPRGENAVNAADGDILIAWALAEAAEFWNEPGYLATANAMVKEVSEKLVLQTANFGPVLTPAVEGFSRKEREDGPIVNLSYWVYPAFPRLAQLMPAFDWVGLAQTGLSLTDRSHFGAFRLPSDWLSLRGEAPQLASGLSQRFGYDAVRIPLYLVWGGAATPERVRFIDAAWSKGASMINLTGAEEREDYIEPGYQAIAALVSCASRKIPYPPAFYRYTASQNYFPATLHLLSLIAAAASGGACLDQVAISDIVPNAWRPGKGSVLASTSEERVIEDAPINLVEPALGAKKGLKLKHGATENATVRSARFVAWICLGLISVFLCYLPSRPKSGHKNKLRTKLPVESNAPLVSPTPRTLPNRLFQPASDQLAFGAQIEAVAQACVEHSRTLGILYFEMTFPNDVDCYEKTRLVGSLMQEHLRATDHVEVLGPNQIVACICLLSCRHDLERVARRLLKLSSTRFLGSSAENFGLAIYPVNGYGGLELIDSARDDFCLKTGCGTESDCLSVRSDRLLSQLNLIADIRRDGFVRPPPAHSNMRVLPEDDVASDRRQQLMLFTKAQIGRERL